MNKKVFVFLGTNFEEIEAITIIDLLRRGNINVVTVSITNTKEVVGAHNIKIFADEIFDEVKDFSGDMLILPGGGVYSDFKDSKKLKELFLEYNKNKKYIGAICASPTVLASYGLLENKNAVVFPSMENEMVGANVLFEKVVVDENIITSRAVGTAIDFALKLIEILISKEKSDEIKNQIVFE